MITTPMERVLQTRLDGANATIAELTKQLERVSAAREDDRKAYNANMDKFREVNDRQARELHKYRTREHQASFNKLWKDYTACKNQRDSYKQTIDRLKVEVAELEKAAKEKAITPAPALLIEGVRYTIQDVLEIRDTSIKAQRERDKLRAALKQSQNHPLPVVTVDGVSYTPNQIRLMVLENHKAAALAQVNSQLAADLKQAQDERTSIALRAEQTAANLRKSRERVRELREQMRQMADADTHKKEYAVYEFVQSENRAQRVEIASLRREIERLKTPQVLTFNGIIYSAEQVARAMRSYGAQSTLQASYDALQSEYADLRKEVERLREERKTYSSNMKIAKENIEELQRGMNLLQEQKDIVAKANADKAAEIDGLRRMIESHVMHPEKMTTPIGLLNVDAAGMRALCDALARYQGTTITTSLGTVPICSDAIRELDSRYLKAIELMGRHFQSLSALATEGVNLMHQMRKSK